MAVITAAVVDVGANGQWKASQGTITADKQAWLSTATWNSGATTFVHLKANVTDTASAAASLLIDLQVGGVSQFKVSKGGVVTAATSFVATTLTGTLSTAAQPNVTSVGALTSLTVSGQLNVTDANLLQFGSSGVSGTGTIRFPNARSLGWRNAADSGDITLTLDASNIFQFTGAITSSAGVTATTATFSGDVKGAKILASGAAGDLGTAGVLLAYQGGGVNRIYGLGADDATVGTLALIVAKRNVTDAVTALSFSTTGAATFASSITTSAPTGGAGAWELGTANAVSPTSPNRTITIEIGGTAYYLHAKTTND